MMNTPTQASMMTNLDATQTLLPTSNIQSNANASISFIDMLSQTQQPEASPQATLPTNHPAILARETLKPQMQNQSLQTTNPTPSAELPTLLMDDLQDQDNDEPLYCLDDNTRLNFFEMALEMPLEIPNSSITTTQLPQIPANELVNNKAIEGFSDEQKELDNIYQDVGATTVALQSKTTSSTQSTQATKNKIDSNTQDTKVSLATSPGEIAIESLDIDVNHKTIPQSVSHLVNQFSDYLNQAATVRQASGLQTSAPIKDSQSLYQVVPDTIEQAEPYFMQQSPYNFKIDNYHAKLKVYPQDLGEIQADIKFDPRGSSLTLSTEHPEVSQWIEGHLQGLRDAFQEANIPLLDINFAASPDKKQNPDEQQTGQSGQSSAHSSEEQDKTTDKKTARPGHNALVDTYA